MICQTPWNRKVNMSTQSEPQFMAMDEITEILDNEDMLLFFEKVITQ